MKSGNCHLTQLIASEVAKKGAVSFAWFMEQALYHPEHGYYSSGRAQLGRRGDYFTSVSVGPVFGKILALQITEVWEHLDRPANFTIVEQGADTGALASDVLTALAETSADCFEVVRYRIVEPFPALRDSQMRTLAAFRERIQWCSSIDTLEPFVGVHFSNELLDAMPVHIARSCSGNAVESKWVEKMVGCRNGQFQFVEQPITDDRIAKELQRAATTTAGIELEINLGALNWLSVLSKKVQRGYVLTIDYGFVEHDLADPPRPARTLQCRTEHRLVDSPFDCIGECDISAHVNWTRLAKHAQEQGFRIAGFADQHHFLTGIISEQPALVESAGPASRRQLQTLVHPEMMGRSFQVLGLSRGVSTGAGLSGFKFARPAEAELGLRATIKS